MNTGCISLLFICKSTARHVHCRNHCHYHSQSKNKVWKSNYSDWSDFLARTDFEPKMENAKDDLLALFTFTGGVPKYVDLFMQNGCTDVEAMIDYMVQPYSPFLDEGNALLIQEFGRKYGNYFALLADIAGGRNTLAELGKSMGETNIAGHVRRLEEDYELIAKKRPIFAKEATQTVRFEISDLFLRFWFRYFVKYRSLVELENYGLLGELIKADYSTYSGLVLESYFRQKMAESGEYRNIGSWWQAKKGKEAPKKWNL